MHLVILPFLPCFLRISLRPRSLGWFYLLGSRVLSNGITSIYVLRWWQWAVKAEEYYFKPASHNRGVLFLPVGDCFVCISGIICYNFIPYSVRRAKVLSTPQYPLSKYCDTGGLYVTAQIQAVSVLVAGAYDWRTPWNIIYPLANNFWVFYTRRWSINSSTILFSSW